MANPKIEAVQNTAQALQVGRRLFNSSTAFPARSRGRFRIEVGTDRGTVFSVNGYKEPDAQRLFEVASDHIRANRYSVWAAVFDGAECVAMHAGVAA